MLSYDGSGNLTKRNNTTYKYDALGRLTQIITDDQATTFTYDPLSRLVSKKTNKTETFYLYDNAVEIGAATKEGQITELRVLGLGIKGDIGASIAIEIDTKIFIPLHNLQGNITALANTEGLIIEELDYDAFGKRSSPAKISPWGFCSKRHHGRLIFFGARFLDPTLQRWITPDPLGFADSRNLYTYVLNDPLSRLDQFGLSSETNYCYNIPVSLQGDAGALYRYHGVISPDRPYVNRNLHPYPNTTAATQYIGQAMIEGYPCHMVVMSSRDINFQYTDTELKQGYFDLFDHIPSLMEGAGNKIACVTYINGVHNSLQDCISMGETLRDEFPEGTLIIGLCNQSGGHINDIFRAFKEKLGKQTRMCRNLRYLFNFVNDTLESKAPEASALHICHSEGGAITYNAIAKMSDEYQSKMKKYFDELAYGPARCIPAKYGRNLVNYYSEKDRITGWFAEKNGDKFTVEILKCETPPNERILWIADHAFAGQTYKNSWSNHLSKLGKKGRIHVYNRR